MFKAKNIFVVCLVFLVSFFLSSCSNEPGEDEAAEVDLAKGTAAEVADAAINSAVMEPIDLVLPKPMFVGTPGNLNVPNLEKPLDKPRPAFMEIGRASCRERVCHRV